MADLLQSMNIAPPALVLLLAALTAPAGQTDPVHDALVMFQACDYASAEKSLRLELHTHPDDVAAAGLLGVVLDKAGKYTGAEAAYRHALALAPQSTSLLNNYGNHLLATGQTAAARSAFLKVVAADPTHQNANEQLARIAVEARAGPEALRYLNRLGNGARDLPAIRLLQLRALYLAGRDAQAAAALKALSSDAQKDPQLNFSLGLALAAARQFRKAEGFFSLALESAPADFNILYNLGVAALRAGDYERAASVLRTALDQHPDDVDVLYHLGLLDTERSRNEEALVWLARAVKLSPRRADAELLLARTAFGLGYYADSVLAWDRYYKLAPSDDAARRERGFAKALTGRVRDGLSDLRWYIARHPGDATGQFETAVALTASDRAAARTRLDRALAIDPDYTPALYAYGVLLYNDNQPEAALADFMRAAKRQPENSAILDQLGRTYLALDRYADAVAVLQQAEKLSPRDSRILIHLSRALSGTGQTEQARQMLNRFRALGPRAGRTSPGAGFVDLLALPPQEQYERYRMRVKKAVANDPTDAGAQLRYAKLLLDDGAWAQAGAVARDLIALKPPPSTLAEAGRAFLDAGQYATAAELLRDAGAALDLAIAVFHTDGPQTALEMLDRIAAADRSGDYYLARAEIEEAMGRFTAAVSSVNAALRAAPTRVDLYLQVTLLLIRHAHVRDALQLLDQADRFLPGRREILLAKAVVLEVASRNEESESLLKSIENRWPEWPQAHLTRGIILETRKSAGEAIEELNTAVSLGANDASAYFYLAEALHDAKPDERTIAQQAIHQALELDPADPWAHALAGRMYYEGKDYEAALKELRAAVRLRPRMVQAHYFLARVYRSLGQEERARSEFEQARALTERFPNEADDPDLLHSNLFSVAPPRE
jgi:tetratricopeptide (TPR) repeat protein